MLAQKTGKQISNESLRIGYSQFTTEIKKLCIGSVYQPDSSQNLLINWPCRSKSLKIPNIMKL